MPYLLIALAALGAIIVASVFSRRTGLAAPLLLVLIGIGGSYLPGVPHIEVEPELVLAGVLPPLLYASSVRLPGIDFRRNVKMIAWLSIVLVVVSALAVGLIVHLIFPQISFPLAVALGAVVSPTDAVAATAIGKRLGLPHRLMTVLEGESLVNDASALVVLRTAVAATAGAFSLWHAVGEFVLAVVIAAAVGFVVGWLTVLLRAKLDDPVLNSAVSFTVPFIAYFPTEELNASGVLAVVVAGLVTGNAGVKRFSARDRQTESTNWATISFVLESGLFLLMGLQLPGLVRSLDEGSSPGMVAGATGVTLVVIIVLRAVWVAFPQLLARGRPAKSARIREQLDQVSERIDQADPETDREQNRLDWMRRRVARGNADVDFLDAQPITRRGSLVLGWAGMRGAITVAAAQTIPEDVPLRSTAVLIAFIVAVITLIGFGGTLPWVIRKLDLEEVSAHDKRAEVTSLMRSMLDTVTEALGPIAEQTVDGEPIDPEIADRMVNRLAPMFAEPPDPALQPSPAHRQQAQVLMRRYLDAMRDALQAEQSIGAYRTETFTQVRKLLDSMEYRLDGG
ncbi:cation:proton antiporter [Nakamurella lactea]|uniref:cation:proton antiporter n=1 Tax=Nakamurella lactea TaxID=459515 RepID=UPI000401970C|nr:sodium:proton antiporter [Nakamurella lactea]